MTFSSHSHPMSLITSPYVSNQNLFSSLKNLVFYRKSQKLLRKWTGRMYTTYANCWQQSNYSFSLYRLPTDVQAEAIPLILGGGDVLMAAETGSGKTGAFCLPILQIVWETLKDLAEGKGKKGAAAVTIPSWTMSFFDRGNALAVTPDGLRCQSREFKEWHGCRATTGVKG